MGGGAESYAHHDLNHEGCQSDGESQHRKNSGRLESFDCEHRESGPAAGVLVQRRQAIFAKQQTFRVLRLNQFFPSTQSRLEPGHLVDSEEVALEVALQWRMLKA